MSQPSAEVLVHDNQVAQRYEARLDGTVVGYLDYRDRNGRRFLVHTEVDPALGGRGIGSRLAAGALSDARARNLPVVPRCPFVRAYLERHPEYADLVELA